MGAAQLGSDHVLTECAVKSLGLLRNQEILPVGKGLGRRGLAPASEAFRPSNQAGGIQEVSSFQCRRRRSHPCRPGGKKGTQRNDCTDWSHL